MAKKRLDNALLDAEVNFINGKIKELSDQHTSNKHHLAWKTIKELSGKNSNSAIQIKGESAKKRMKNWTSHFKNLLGKEAKLPDNLTLPSVKISDQLNSNVSSFTLDEVKVATKQLNTSKAFGPDNIPALIWKDPIFHHLLLDLCNLTFETNKSPSIWHRNQIIPTPKKGDLSLASNYGEFPLCLLLLNYITS